MTCGPGLLLSAAPEIAADRRSRRWKLLASLHKVMLSPAYRYRSLDKALFSVAQDRFVIKESEFISGTVAEYQFDRKMRMDLRLASLYRCFDGAAQDAVDYRFILCSFRLLVLAPRVHQDALGALQSLVGFFMDEGCQKAISRQNLLGVLSLAAISDEDVACTAGRLDSCLSDAAALWNMSRSFHIVTMAMFSEVLESHPEILHAAAHLMWARVPAETRLEILGKAEDLRFIRFTHTIRTIRHKRAVACYARNVYRKHWRAWVTYTVYMKRLSLHQEQVVVRTQHQYVWYWRQWAQSQAYSRNRRSMAAICRRRVLLRRTFRRIVGHTKLSKTLRRLCWSSSTEGKHVLFGGALLKDIQKRALLRFFMRRWNETAACINAWEFAANLADDRLRAKFLHALRDHVCRVRLIRKAEEETRERSRLVQEAIAQAEAERKMLEDAAEAAAKRKKAQEKEALVQQRTAEALAARQAIESRLAARNDVILKAQAQSRRDRVHRELIHLKKKHDEEWAFKIVERMTDDATLVKAFLGVGQGPNFKPSKEAHFRLEKELRVLKRKFFAAPSPDTAKLELALQDPANVIFAHIGNKLFARSQSLRNFFAQYDSAGKGFLAYADFNGLVTSLGIQMSNEQIRQVLAAIDEDKSGVIEFGEFQEAMARHQEVCGSVGSPWKMYVNPVHAVMTYHNIETNEEIWDYKATDSDLMRVVKDNLVGIEEAESKERALAAKEDDWTLKLQNRAARVIQNMYWLWRGRRERDRARWATEAKKLREAAVRDRIAATQLQCWWRCLTSKWQALILLHICIEKVFDPGFAAAYYYNHVLKEASWKKPYLLARWVGEEEDLQDTPEWVSIFRSSGSLYYYNTLNHEMNEEIPAGYFPCQHCSVQLAKMRCKWEGLILCCNCFRKHHAKQKAGWKHPFEPMTVLTCTMCSVRTAQQACKVCSSQMMLCRQCWDRKHGANTLSHASSSVVEWLLKLEEDTEPVVPQYDEKGRRLYDEDGHPYSARDSDMGTICNSAVELVGATEYQGAAFLGQLAA